MCIMNANVEYSCWPTKVPFVCRESYHASDGNLSRIYYRFVRPAVWFGLRKICH